MALSGIDIALMPGGGNVFGSVEVVEDEYEVSVPLRLKELDEAS